MPFPTLRPDSYGAANRLFSGGIDRFTGAMENYSTRIQDRANSNAVSQLLGVEAQGTPNEYRAALGGIDTGYAQGDKVLNATNSLLNPYASQYNSDRNYGIAAGGLAERQRHNKVQESRPTAASQPNTKTIEDINPYTGEKSYYHYNSKDANPTFTPVDMGGGGDYNTPSDYPTNEDGFGNKVISQNDTAQPGAYEQNFMAMADANPIDVGRAGAMTAGLGNAGGSGALPQSQGVTYGKPDRYGVSMGSDGTFRTGDGNYVIPLKMREVKEITDESGSTSFVVINKATGRDASGKPVGDAGQTKWSHQTVSLPNGQSKREVIGIKPDGTSVTMENGQEVSYQSGTKEPTLVQKDKQYIDGLGSVTPAMDRVGTAIKRDDDIFGPIAAWFDKKQHDDDTINFSGIGQLFGTGDSKAAARFDSDTSRMMSKVIKSLGANPSDRDLKLLEAQVPQRSDEPSTAKMKLDSFKELFYDIQAGTFSRLISSNPSSLDGKAIPEEVASRLYNSLPQGYKLQKNQDTGQIRVIRVGG